MDPSDRLGVTKSKVMVSRIPLLQVTEMQPKERAGCFSLASKGAALNLCASIAIGAAWFSTVGLGTAKSTGAGGGAFAFCCWH